MPREKVKFALRMAPETQQLVKEMCPRDNCQTQNEFIEKAIRFYAGYISGEEAVEFLPAALVTALQGSIQSSESRTARLLFKLAVEMDIVMNILAAEINASPEVVEKVRGRCIQNVKKTCGYISFRDAAEYQYRPPEDDEDE